MSSEETQVGAGESSPALDGSARYEHRLVPFGWIPSFCISHYNTGRCHARANKSTMCREADCPVWARLPRQNNAVRGAAEPRTVDAALDVIGPLFLEACSLLDNAALRDTEPWQRAFAELKAKAKQAIPSNATEHRT